MKPILLEKISDYPNSGYGYLTEAYNQKIHETSEGEYTYEFDLPASSKLFKFVKQDMWVYIEANKNQMEFFYIDNLKIKNNPDSLHAVCYQQTVLLKDLYTDKILTPDGGLFFIDYKRVTVKSLISRLNDAIASTNKYGIKFETDVDRTINYPMMASGSLIDYLNNDSIGLLKILGNVMMVRKGNTVLITENVGEHTIDIRRGKNINGVNIEKDYSTIVNSVQYFTFEKFIWDINYKPVYSKLYKYPNYDNFTRTRDLKIYTDEADLLWTKSTLDEMVNDYVAQHPNASDPKYTLAVDIIEYGQEKVQECCIGDLARIYDPILDIQTVQPIYDRTYDPDQRINTSFKAGTVEQSIFNFLDKRITSNDFSNKTNAAKLNVVSGNVDETNKKISSANSDISSIKSDVSSTMSDVSSTKSDVSSMKTTINSLQSKISDLERKIK